MSRLPMMGMGMPTGMGPGIMESQMGLGAQMPMPPEETMPKKKKRPVKKKTGKKMKKK